MLHRALQFLLFVNKSFLFLFLSTIITRITFAQIPSIACPNYFQYTSENSRYIGKITLPNINAGVTRIEVHLSQQGSVPSPNPSRLSLYDDQATTINKVLTAQPISYRVEFPTSYQLPKLTLISVNGAVLCADQNYPPPSSQVKLTHTLEMSAFSTLVPYSISDKGFVAQVSNGLNVPMYASNLFHPKERPLQQQQQQLQQQQPHPQPQFQIQSPTYYNTNLYSPHTNFGFNSGANIDNNGFKQMNAVVQPPPLPPTSASPSLTPAVFQSPATTANLDEVCGRETATFTPLIRGGSQIKRGQFPWLTAIYRKKGTDLAFICGGSLLSARTVISAAHCFKEQNIPANKILLFLGRHNLASIGEEGSVYRQVENLILHPEYDAKVVSDADIAILQLQQPVSFTSYITPICLWNQAIDVNFIVGYSAFVAGWGATEQGDPVSLIPKKVETQIVDENSCRTSLQKYQSLQSSRTICGHNGGNEGPCTGDSGGGLMIFQQGRWLLRGIISAGLTRYGQCAPNETFYFCDVAKHLNWISSQILT